MSLYTRLMTFDPLGRKISVHGFFAVMQEYSLGNMTAQQAKDALGLDDAEAAEANALRLVILAESAQNGGIARRIKALEFEQVLILAEHGFAPYTTEAAIKARLGVT